jgi:hypothetical protein
MDMWRYDNMNIENKFGFVIMHVVGAERGHVIK